MIIYADANSFPAIGSDFTYTAEKNQQLRIYCSFFTIKKEFKFVHLCIVRFYVKND